MSNSEHSKNKTIIFKKNMQTNFLNSNWTHKLTNTIKNMQKKKKWQNEIFFFLFSKT